LIRIKVVDSASMGRESKKISPSIFYVCCDKNTVLGNKYCSFRKLEDVSGTATEKRVILRRNEKSCAPEAGIRKFLEKFPREKVMEIIKYIKKKKIKELRLGDENFPYDSHAYEIAEFISSTGESFSLNSPSGKKISYKNQRDFERELLFYPPSFRNSMVLEFRQYLARENVELHVHLGDNK